MSDLTTERWRQISELYNSACDREPAERDAFLERACGLDKELRGIIKSMLAQHSGSGNILDSPAIDAFPVEATSTRIAVGEVLGPYKIEAPIGAGGMAKVFRAVDTRLGRRVALKVASEQFISRFEREARAISALNHPHICTLYDVGPNYLVMELVEGETLSGRLKQGALDIEVVLRYGLQIADALMEAHEKGIVHRDLKPGNIMIAKMGVNRTGIKILDFGIAKTSGDTLTLDNVIIGTLAYMAPEQLQGREADARSDIFSFGLVLYEMATGKPLVREDPAQIDSLPEMLAHVVRRCLEPIPDNRWQSARDIEGELGRAAKPPFALPRTETLPLPATASLAATESQVSPSRSSIITRRRVIWLAGATSATAVGVTAWRLWPPSSGIRSLAVLPFENTPNDDEDAEAVAIGLTENLIRKIAGLPELTVKSRAAVSTFKGRSTDPRTAGQQLGVQAIVTGAVTRRPGKLHISVELVDARTSTALWGPTSYDRDEGDLQLIEDEIASAIVQDGIRFKLSPDDRARLARHSTDNAEADKLYRLALLHWDKETRADYLIARDLLLKAVDQDPKFARAYQALARSYGSMVIDGYEPPKEGFRQMKLYANNALLLDPQDPTLMEVHGQLAAELFWIQRKWKEAEQEFKMAVQAPGSPAYEPFVYLLWATHRGGEALALVHRAQEDDPVSLKWRLREADLLRSIGRGAEAERAYRSILRDSPEDRRAYLSLAHMKREQKQFPAAIDLLRQGYEVARETDSITLDLLRTAQGEAGYLEIEKREAQLELQYLQSTALTEYVSPLEFARVHARLGHKDEAFRYIEQAFEEGSPGLVLLNVDPAWTLVRNDRRFADAVKKAGLP